MSGTLGPGFALIAGSAWGFACGDILVVCWSLANQAITEQRCPIPLVRQAREVAASRAVLAAISHGKASVEHELDALFRRLNDEDVGMLKKTVHVEDTADAMLA